jgi:hypothetical protein
MKLAMPKILGRLLPVLALPALALLFAACAPPAIVFLSPHYNPATIKKVALINFQDYPAMAGSGQLVAGIFEQSLLQSGTSPVDPPVVAAAMQQLSIQPGDPLDLDTLHALAAKLGCDAFILGQVTDFTDATDQTVVEDMIRTTQDIQTGNDITTVDQPVAQNETVPAHVGLSVRMIDAQTGEVLWSASDSEDGTHLNDAAQFVSEQIMGAYAKSVKASGL